MFIKLSRHGYENSYLYINSNEIRSFETEVINGKRLTVINKQNGVDIVKETPEQIMEMLKGEK